MAYNRPMSEDGYNPEQEIYEPYPDPYTPYGTFEAEPRRRYNTTPAWQDPFTPPNPSEPEYAAWYAANPGYEGPPPQQTGPAGGGTTGTRTPADLFREWKQTHTPQNPDIDGLIKFLAANGVTGVTRATHAGNQLSDDKVLYNGQTLDLGTSLGSGEGQWFDWTPMGDGGSGGGGGAIDPALLAPWTERFQGPGSLPTFSPPGFQRPPEFKYDPFKAPSFEEAQQEPGYQFALDQGIKALQQSAAGKGILRTGGTLKDIVNYGQAAGAGNYQDVYNRGLNTYQTNFGNALATYGTNYGVSKDAMDYLYKGAQDQFNSLAAQNSADYQRAQNDYLTRYNIFRNNQNDPFQKTLSLAQLGAGASA